MCRRFRGADLGSIPGHWWNSSFLKYWTITDYKNLRHGAFFQSIVSFRTGNHLIEQLLKSAQN
jgi:hypothetical protein